MLYSKLKAYSQTDYYGFHMPGHKRNRNVTGIDLPYHIDITEIDGFDDLHHAKGILKESQEYAAALYQSEETHFLINGSTVGILSAVLGCTEKGGRILMARNCHKSVYHAAHINELNVVYLYPEIVTEARISGEIFPEIVRKALEKYADIQAVIITSPTYDGVVSDIREIANITHKYSIPLIVDEAHGAHFGFHPYFPGHAVSKGADVVIHSLHKTLPALTQTAVLHMNGTIIKREQIRNYLHMLQSSSPSYILMAGIDACMRVIGEKGDVLFASYVQMLTETRKQLKDLKCLHLVETKRYDKSKILISTANTGWTGKKLKQCLLENYHLQMEMETESYVVAMTSVGDNIEGMNRLTNALMEIDTYLQKEESKANDKKKTEKDGKKERIKPEEIEWRKTEQQRSTAICRLPETECVFSSSKMEVLLREYRKQVQTETLDKTISKLDLNKKEKKIQKEERVCILPWEECEGYISTEFAYLYPPGIPLLVPGERISREVINVLQNYAHSGLDIEGIKVAGKIEVWKNG